MGGASSAELADIRMFEILENILASFPHRDKIVFCARYRDDGFILYNGTFEEMHEFFRIANNSHRHLKFTYEISLEQITFLYTMVYKGDRFLSTGVLDLRT